MFHLWHDVSNFYVFSGRRDRPVTVRIQSSNVVFLEKTKFDLPVWIHSSSWPLFEPIHWLNEKVLHLISWCSCLGYTDVARAWWWLRLIAPHSILLPKRWLSPSLLQRVCTKVRNIDISMPVLFSQLFFIQLSRLANINAIMSQHSLQMWCL